MSGKKHEPKPSKPDLAPGAPETKTSGSTAEEQNTPAKRLYGGKKKGLRGKVIMDENDAS